MNPKSSTLHRPLYWACLLFALALTRVEHADAQGCYCRMDSKSVSALTNKYGTTEYCNGSSPKKYYLVETITHQLSSSFTCSPTGGESVQGSKNVTTSISPSTGKVADSGHASINETCSGCPECAPFNYSGTLTDGSDGSPHWDDGGEAQTTLDDEKPTGGTSTCSKTVKTYTYTYTGSGSGSWTENNVLSSEFTDDMLRGNLIGGLPPYPADWSYGTGTAYYTLDSDHYQATGGKMKYHVKVPNSIKGVNYLVKWQEVTTYPNNTSSSEDKHESITGTGDPVNPALGTDHDVDVPKTPSTIHETAPEISTTSGSEAGN